MIECPYCNSEAELTSDKAVYGRSYGGMIWLCRPCDAYVGTHKNSKKHAPLGRMANKELREWKMKAHRAFDPLWKRKIEKEQCSKSYARNRAYKWLAGKMRIDVKYCHIGHFDIEHCKLVVGLCSFYSRRASGKM